MHFVLTYLTVQLRGGRYRHTRHCTCPQPVWLDRLAVPDSERLYVTFYRHYIDQVSLCRRVRAALPWLLVPEID